MHDVARRATIDIKYTNFECKSVLILMYFIAVHVPMNQFSVDGPRDCASCLVIVQF